jgi:hypothetical protein
MNLLNISLLAGIVAMVAWINWKSGKQPMFGYLWYGIWTVAPAADDQPQPPPLT